MRPPQLDDGWYCFLTRLPVQRKVIENGNYAGCIAIDVPIAPLKKEADPTSVVKKGGPTKDGTILPIDNPDYPNHEAPAWAIGMAAQFLHALFDEKELPRPPRKDKKTGKLLYKGRPIKPENEEKCADEASDALGDLCAGLADDGPEGEKFRKELANRIFFGKVGFRDKDESKKWKNVLERAESLPDKETLVDLSDTKAVKTNRPPTRRRRR
jgi:hypothetical protein